MYAVSIPANPGTRGDGDGVAENGRARGDAVDELGDGGVETEEFIERGGEEGELVELGRGGVQEVGGEDFGAESSLESLICAEFPEDGVEQLLGVFVGGEKGDFEVGAVLFVIYLALRESVLEGVDEKIGFGGPWFAGAVARAVFNEVVEEVFEFFHDVEGALAGREDVGVFVQGGEVEEEWFEDCFLYDGLEFFDTGVGFFETLFDCKQLNDLVISTDVD